MASKTTPQDRLDSEQPHSEQPQKKSLTRRRFLQVGGIVLGGAMVAIYPGRVPMRRAAAQTVENLDFPASISSYRPDFWFEVLPDNTIILKSPKVEMGQGIFTGYAMLAAEELEVPLSQIKVEHAATSTGVIDSLGTGGSTSTSSMFTPIREVAATMREMLKAAAAKEWGVDVSAVTASNGSITSGSRTITYADIAQKTKQWDIPKTPALKPASAFKYVGKDTKRVDLKPKVMGKPLFGIDQTMPGMLYAVIVESPYIDGTIKTIKTQEAEKMQGVERVIRDGEFVAVVAKSRYAAETAARALEIEWNVPKKWQQTDIESIVTVGKGTEVEVQNEGNAKSIIEKSSDGVFKQEYRAPLGAHAQMEPNGSIAHVEKDKVTIVIGTQVPSLIRDQVAKALGIDAEKVEVRTAYLGGGFGRRYSKMNAADAAKISKIVGKPVSVFNTREQEFQNSMYRPNTHHVLRAKITSDGSIEAIAHDQATPDMIIEGMAGEVGMTVFGADFISAGHGASIIYNTTNRAATLWHNKLPFTTGIWRGVGIFANTFAIESFINELAHKLGKDPIALRLELVAGNEKINTRYIKALETLAEKSAWKLPKTPGTGRGMALANDRKTIAAAAVEVMVTDGVIHVRKVTHVLDVGIAVNPEGIRMQMEGCVMMGISASLYEGLQVKDGQIGASNFHEYPVATLRDAPEIQTVILEGDDVPYGVGEPPIAPIAPAIAAAVFDATGVMPRALPLKIA